MGKFRDRDKATKNINALLADHTIPMMVLSGGKRTGKTEFAKYISKKTKNAIYLSPGFGGFYAEGIVCSIMENPDLSLCIPIKEFLKRNTRAKELLQSLEIKYVYSLSKEQVPRLISILIREDITTGLYLFANFLGTYYSEKLHYVFMDDFHRCDQESYIWIIEFWRALATKTSTIIAICNFEQDWESNRLHQLFAEMPSPVSIEQFDSERAYFDILKDSVFFENDTVLKALSKQLYELYNGSSQLLFETINVFNGEKQSTSDRERVNNLLQIANKLRFNLMEGLSNTHFLVLKLLGYSIVPITKDCIIDILELNDEITTKVLSELYDANLICPSVDGVSGKTTHSINGDVLLRCIRSGCTQQEAGFFEIKIYRAIQRGKIVVTLEQRLRLSIRIKEDDSLELLTAYCAQNSSDIHDEKKAFYLDMFIQTMIDLPTKIATAKTARFLYTYGYYSSAEKIMRRVLSNEDQCTYDNLVLYGDIQHLLLSPMTSKIFKHASEIKGISVSEKCKAINRQIMALNQEHQERHAKELYESAFRRFGTIPSIGLVELCRNTNNSYGYDDTIRYTVAGYNLAKDLGAEFEMYKCLHNICMVQLQYGKYGKPLNDESLGFVPKFEIVLNYFRSHSEFWHEQAYPLLDLGVAQMFEFAKTSDKKHLTSAKRYYSEAQLYARSFYARHIAECGLLVINSYIYNHQYPAIVDSQRKSCYGRYIKQKNTIEDYRVHRKILLSLALSALISGEKNEAAEYLLQAFPYISGYETARFNKLCQKAGCTNLLKEAVPLEERYDIYYSSDQIVPWIISLAH